jgi:hypothetical protein
MAKDKAEHFVPVPPSVSGLLGSAPEKKGQIFKNITDQRLPKRVKEFCTVCGFENPRRYKVKSLRHHVVSLCANQNMAYCKNLRGWDTARRRCSTCIIIYLLKTSGEQLRP